MNSSYNKNKIDVEEKQMEHEYDKAVKRTFSLISDSKQEVSNAVGVGLIVAFIFFVLPSWAINNTSGNLLSLIIYVAFLITGILCIRTVIKDSKIKIDNNIADIILNEERIRDILSHNKESKPKK